MKARVIFEVEVIIEVPDELPEQVRELARTLGENYVAVDAGDQLIIERIALIRGVRGFDYDESMTEELNQQVQIEMLPELTMDFEWLEQS